MLELTQAVGVGAALGLTALLGWGLRRVARTYPAALSSLPQISVLVAACNEEAALPDCLDSLAAQDYPADLSEFIIIDDGSTDRTAEIVDTWAARHPRFRLVKLADQPPQELGPKKRALSAGIQISTGEILMVTDADCTLGPRWVSLMVSGFEVPVSVVCGGIQYRQTGAFWSRLAAFEGLINTVLSSAVIGLGEP